MKNKFMLLKSVCRDSRNGVALATLVWITTLNATAAVAASNAPSAWVEKVLSVPYAASLPAEKAAMQLLYQDASKLGLGTPCSGNGQMTIGSKNYTQGLGTHANSRIRIYSPEPIARFTAMIGVENNDVTNPGRNNPIGSVVFVVIADTKELYRSERMIAGQEATKVDLETGGVRIIDLMVTDGGNGHACDWANWANAIITLANGKTQSLHEIPQAVIPIGATRYPFSFLYDGRSSDAILESWKKVEAETLVKSDGRTLSATTWTDPKSGLAVTWETTRFPDFQAVEWVLYFENTGKSDSAIVEKVQALDLNLDTPKSSKPPYVLHKTRGGTYDAIHFEPTVLDVDAKNPQRMDSGHGRSSGKDFPFFKIETGAGSVIAAIGWSGYWQSLIECQDGKHLRMMAGPDKTHFRLHAGERVRTLRILLMNWPGDTLESNAQFRQLIYKYYTAKRSNELQLPISFCNTCFTRGGVWLNECNAENQISLIEAYSKLGLEALITDAGWFTGGWPKGAGNWDPRKDAYPNGIEPVAKAAKDRGMIYGLWFEPERVVAGTAVQRQHPAWCLPKGKEPQKTYLLNFGLKEVQDYFFNIVKGFMDMPGFRVYRQDFNMDPRPFWTYNDAPDRQGITEMKYIEGLYAYWDRLGNTWPDSLREECASGGYRIDLETIQRLHIAQKTDYWFNYDVDQAALWGVSQYLPNNTIVAHLNTLDDYAFHSTLASSLCVGWIADAPDFEVERGKQLLTRYQQVRHLLIGAWYPLLPYSRDKSQWMASQYHRQDLAEGMILAFRRPDSQYNSVQVSLRGLDATANYELRFDSTGKKVLGNGADLIKSFEIGIPDKHKSDLITYRKVRPN